MVVHVATSLRKLFNASVDFTFCQFARLACLAFFCVVRLYLQLNILCEQSRIPSLQIKGRQKLHGLYTTYVDAQQYPLLLGSGPLFRRMMGKCGRTGTEVIGDVWGRDNRRDICASTGILLSTDAAALRVFKRKVLRKTFGPVRVGVDIRVRFNNELYELLINNKQQH